MSETVRFERRGKIGVITVDNPPVNALSSSVRQGLVDSLSQGLADSEVKAFVLIGASQPPAPSTMTRSASALRLVKLCMTAGSKVGLRAW